MTKFDEHFTIKKVPLFTQSRPASRVHHFLSPTILCAFFILSIVFSKIVYAASSYSFDSDSVGSIPTGWTSIAGTWQTQNDQAHSVSNSLKIIANQDRGRALENSSIYTDVTVTTKTYISSSDGKPGLILRSNASGSSYYRFFYNAGTLYIQKPEPTIVSTSYTLPATGAWYYIKAQAIGTNLRMKIWRVIDSEPVNWNLETTDNTLSSGQVGVFAHNSAAWFDDIEIDDTGTPQSSPSPIPSPIPSPGIVTNTGVTYSSTLDNLNLKMDVAFDNSKTNLPIVLVLHGYSGPFTGTDIIQRMANKGVFAIKTYKRSFGGSQGIPDDSGRETHDFVDAVEYVKQNYSQHVDPTNVNVVGYSGGGGNVYGLVTKFPDYFRTAQIFFGMSDYGFNDNYGWWNNGGTSYRSAMQTRIGGTPSAVRDKYYARAHYLAAKNNPHTSIQLFYDTAENVVPPSHATQYTTNSNAEGFTNVVTRISDAASTTSELSDDFSSDVSDWNPVGAGATQYIWDSPGLINWTTNTNSVFDAFYKRLTSLRNYGKTDHITAEFDFTVSSLVNSGSVFVGFRNSADIDLKNAISMAVVDNYQGSGQHVLLIRTDYNGTPRDNGNRSLQQFTTPLVTGTSYRIHLELNNGTITAILKDSGGNTLETQNLTMDNTKGFDGIDAFGIFDYGGTQPAGLTGTLDNVSITAHARWIHGYPQEGAGGAEGTITAENYFIPDITAQTYPEPVLQASDSMFIPGYIKTERFAIQLGDGNDEAGNLSFDLSGVATSVATAKTLTVEGVTGDASIQFDLFNLSPNTEYIVVDNDLTHGNSGSSLINTDGNGTLTFNGVLGSTHEYQVFLSSVSPTPTQQPSSGSGSSYSALRPAQAPTCPADVPVGIPDLFQINRTETAAKLYFTPVNDNVGNYHVIYGLKDGDERFGSLSHPVTHESNNGVQSLMISHLNPNAEYWFKVAPVNGCAVGTWSNWMKVGKWQNTESLFYRYQRWLGNWVPALR